MPYKLKLKHKFCAAHQLTHAYSKECNNFMHGHNFLIEVEIKVDELINGMVVDFKIIKEEINKLDHRNLNEILKFEPTAENIAKYLYSQIKNRILKINQSRCFNIKIEIFETDNASIQYYE